MWPAAAVLPQEVFHPVATQACAPLLPFLPHPSSQLVTPPFAPNGSVVPVSVVAISYIGASVAGANINLTWSTTNASGILPLVTDVNGIANGTIDLASLPEVNRTQEFDTLTVTAEWIGPTRERVVDTNSIRWA